MLVDKTFVYKIIQHVYEINKKVISKYQIIHFLSAIQCVRTDTTYCNYF